MLVVNPDVSAAIDALTPVVALVSALTAERLWPGQNPVGKRFKVGDEITLKTGDASIVMKKDGTIALKGKDISIEGSGKISVKASSDVVVKGSKKMFWVNKFVPRLVAALQSKV